MHLRILKEIELFAIAPEPVASFRRLPQEKTTPGAFFNKLEMHAGRHYKNGGYSQQIRTCCSQRKTSIGQNEINYEKSNSYLCTL